jgi:hypothetical protein
MADLDKAWVRMDDFCQRHNQIQGTIQKRVHDGVWERGVLYANPTGGVAYVHEERALAWLKENGKLS